MNRRPGLAAALGILLMLSLGPVPASADEGDVAVPEWSLPDEAPTAQRGGSTPWRTPTRPRICTTEEMESGDVADCLVDGPGGSPSERGFGVPPFPQRLQGALLPWRTVSIGDDGPIVTQIQVALNAAGASLSTDGDFGPMTESAVRDFQRDNGLKASGKVNVATAAALGVERREQGQFPPTGWNWLGWGYNGSPALAAWEAMMVPSAAVPGFSAGRLRGHPAVMRLYEGFMADMTALGYRPYEIGSYVFRCTSGSGKTCDGLSPSSLSNHAFGLAIDMNTAANPEIYYYADGDTSACAVPMRTDIPRSVVRAAEKWGLYWGGYGWYGGCASPSQWRSSQHRDPMHFEFRGDVFIAEAILAHNSGRAIPQRWCGDVVDVVDGRAVGSSRECGDGSRAPSDEILSVRVADSTAVAATVSITTRGTMGGDVRATRCRGRLTWRTLATVSTSQSSVGTLVPLDAGRLCIQVPRGATVQITRTATWSASGELGLTAERRVRTVSPSADGVVDITGSAEAVWVSARPVATARAAARTCADPSDASRPVTWVAGVAIEELQVVPVTPLGETSRWCISRTDVPVAHVARFVADGGSGLVPSVRRVKNTSPVFPDGTTGAVVQVRTRGGDVTIGVCHDGKLVRSSVVPRSSQVSTVFVRASAGNALCVTGTAVVHLLARTSRDATDRLTLSGPARAARVRS